MHSTSVVTKQTSIGYLATPCKQSSNIKKLTLNSLLCENKTVFILKTVKIYNYHITKGLADALSL